MQYFVFPLIITVISAFFMGIVYLIRKFNKKLIYIPTVLLLLFTVYLFYMATTIQDLGALGFVIFGLISASTTIFVFIFTLLLGLGVIFNKS